MNSFKMRVKEGQTAEAIQNYMFSCGAYWYGDKAEHQHPDAKFFFATGRYLTYEFDSEDYFNEHEAEEFFFATAVQEVEEIPQQTNDAVNNPTHYTSHPSGIECIDVTRHMSFNLGNATKYIWRCDLKKDAIEDLRKAIFYLNDEINLRLSKKEC